MSGSGLRIYNVPSDTQLDQFYNHSSLRSQLLLQDLQRLFVDCLDAFLSPFLA